MGKDKTSRTGKESWVEERAFGLGDHYKTTISEGGHTVEGRGNTAEEAEKNASENWDKYYDDDDDDDE